MAAKDLYEKDLYQILGVAKNASSQEIKKAYRGLARELHPDKNKGDKVREEKFKAVSEANDILSDEKKRAEYDDVRARFERGGFRVPQGGQGGAGGAGNFEDVFGGGSPQDIFANLFGGRRGPRRGQDLQTESTISFRESIFGTTLELRLTSANGSPQNITARVPAGVTDGGKIRLKGKGAPGEGGAGDLFINLHVTPHPLFTHVGINLTITLPITFVEATLGADIKIPTLTGEEVTVRISPGTPSGRVLRVKGRGVQSAKGTGDLLVTVDVQVPRRVDAVARQALEDFAKATASENVRAEFASRAKL
ncbi:MAG: DnaJ domain-containing protein [Actinobacteria bacterium]|nr:DnaJ domain-containing protein [Actinomycetota bacterium]